jgi:hypothetical protein
VDATRPDSAVARHFAELVDRREPEARRWLELWASNNDRLRPLIDTRQILKEAGPISKLLAKIAAQALAGQSGTPEMKAAQQPNWRSNPGGRRCNRKIRRNELNRRPIGVEGRLPAEVA